MKEDKEKEEHLEAMKKELNEKISKLMGPTINEQEPSSKRISPAIPADPKVRRKLGSDKPQATTESKPVVTAVKPRLTPGTAEETLDDVSSDEDFGKLIDEIAANESDDLLKAEDEAVQRAFQPQAPRTIGTKIKDFFKNWWDNPKARKATIATLIIAFLIVSIVPNSRYFVLNTVGVRSSASIKILDDSTQQPLKNVNVSLSGQSGQTDEEGYVKLSKIRLGKNELKVERRAFAEKTKTVVIGWGSNPLGELPITPTGLQYSFKTSDFLSEKPIQKAEAVSGEFSAFSDENGEILLTLDTKNDEEVLITLKAEGYRNETIKASFNDDKMIDVKMVAGRPHVFVSKRSGKFDVYKIDADGKNEELVLAGTGAERDDMVLVGHPKRNVAALVSTRENLRNSDDYLLSTLTIIDLDTTDKQDLSQSEQFQVVGWVDDILVYVKIVSGESASNPNRHKLISYNYDTGETKEIAHSNYFNDVLIANGKIYYAPSSTSEDATSGLFAINPDGTNNTKLINSEAWNLFRTNYDKLSIAVGQSWYDYELSGTAQPTALSGAPANPTSRIYVNSPDDTRSLWIDQRDGKGVLISHEIKKNEDANLVAQSGLINPVRWLNDTTAVYRIKTDQEVADYVISSAGGKARKLVDVTNTAGIDNWYYY